jgi:hypothetical protein
VERVAKSRTSRALWYFLYVVYRTGQNDNAFVSRIVTLGTQFAEINPTAMAIQPKRASVFIETDEEPVTCKPMKKRLKSVLDESTICLANELLALRGNGPLSDFRPLFRPRDYCPASKPVVSKNKNERLLVAISDDEDDKSSSNLFPTTLPLHKPLPLRHTTESFSGPSLMGRPLPPRPRLPQLKPGQLVVISPKASSLGTPI